MKYLIPILIIIQAACFGQSTNELVLKFATTNMGKKIDRGECWDLANAALNNANAQWESPFNFGDKLDYKKLGLKPGDVLQFTNVKFIFPNGSASFPKHTAIVYAANKNKVTMIHQNFNNKRYVDTLTVDFDKIKNGKIEAYRPKAKIN